MTAFSKKSSSLSNTALKISPDAVHRHGSITQGEVIKRNDIPEGLWEKCKKCGEIIFSARRTENWEVCPKCGYHYPLTAIERIELLVDIASFEEIDENLVSVDTLNFVGDAPYTEKLIANRKKTGMLDAVMSGTASLDGRPFVLAVMDFRFLGASMGAVVGEKITRAIEKSTELRQPIVIVSASGGARMYEGMISLMQMAKTSGALKRHAEAGLPYISILTHPTTAGVMASYASLGDIILAEPEALVGFAGRRVIEATTQAQLPPGFQTAEFLLQKGLIDRIVERKDLHRELSKCLEYFAKAK